MEVRSKPADLLLLGLNPSSVTMAAEIQDMERMPIQSALASPGDAEIILKLYDLRREEVMRKARAWVIGEFWPSTADEYFNVATNPADPHNAYVRQVISFWEMAAALVLHGTVSAELFVDCNNEGFFLLAKFDSILDAVRERNPMFLARTSDLVKRFPAAAARFEIVKKNVEGMRARLAAAARAK
jgi:hypothetical protein